MENPPRLLLASLELGAAVEPLELQTVLFVPTAANGLPDRDAIVHAYRSQLEALDLEIIDWDVDDLTPDAAVPVVDAICCSGGNPYHLLRACRRSGFDRVITELVDRGVLYLGASAGALLAGPSLDPIVDVTPFSRPADFDGVALGLTQRLVLPHDDRPGRRAAHAAAQSAHGATHRMVAIGDSETVRVRGDEWELRNHTTGQRFRPASAGDAAAIAECYLAAGRAAWDFVDADHFAAMEPPVEAWTDRLRSLADPDDALVVEDAGGLAGFVWIRPAFDPDLGHGVGELGAFYTHPRMWGGGSGRRALQLALDRLRASGCHTAVLYTEERNRRPRRLYERLGWRTDGEARDREFLGAAIREVRYRLAL